MLKKERRDPTVNKKLLGETHLPAAMARASLEHLHPWATGLASTRSPFPVAKFFIET